MADTASSVKATVDTGLQRDIDFQKSVGDLIATTPGLTNHRLTPWLASLDLTKLYPGAVGLSFFVPVTSNRLPSYQAAVTTDPPSGYPPGPYQISPPGQRQIYCLERLGIELKPTGEPPGVDICAQQVGLTGVAPIAALVNTATSTGTPAISFIFQKGASAKSLGMTEAVFDQYRDLFLVISPVYAGGVIPSSASGRTSSVIGWMLGTYSGSALIDAARAGNGRTAVTLGSRDGSILATAGRVSGPGMESVNSPSSVSPDLRVKVTAAIPSGPTLHGIVLGSLGASVSVLLFAFALHLGRSKERAERLVEQRTAQLRYQALHDPLTDLPNRALVFDRAHTMVARARREDVGIGALYMDLDDFKQVNDTFGHDIGDALLKAVAGRLKTALRGSDTVGRLGGDEFLILSEDDSPDAGLEHLAERIHSVLRAPFELPGSEPVVLNVQASVGIAAGIRASAEELIRDADIALYQAKELGKGRYVVFQPGMKPPSPVGLP